MNSGEENIKRVSILTKRQKIPKKKKKKEPNRNLSTEEPWRITELKISIEEFSGRLDRAEERISVFKHKSFEIIQRNGKGKKKKKWNEVKKA